MAGKGSMRWESHRLRVDVRRVTGGTWIAHCLDLDAFAEGGSLTAAAERLKESATEMIQHARAEGFGPFDLPAPPPLIVEFDETMAALFAPEGGSLRVAGDLPEPPEGVHRVLLDMTIDVPIFERTAPKPWRDVPLPPAHVRRHLLTTRSHVAVGS